ncbi:Odorant receptor Or10a [Rhyzopertha dominica]|nr:Odorant receptor Or10a [Rhyzopertha dominica]
MKLASCGDIVQPPKLYLTAIGIWPQKGNFKTWFRYIFIVSTSIGYLFTLLLELKKDFEEKDYNKMSAHLSIFFPILLYCFKLIVLKLRENDFIKVLEMMEAPIFAPRSKAAINYIKQSATRSRYLNNIYVGSCIITLIQFDLLQLFDNVTLPVRFSYDIGKYATAMSIFQSVVILQTGISNSSLDVFAVGLISVASTQLDILNDIIRTSYAVRKEEHKELFKGCVQLHTAICEYVLRLDDVLSLTFLSQFLASVFAICNAGFELVHADLLSLEFPMIALFFMCIVMQLAMYCWFGNEVILKSDEITRACYESNWEDFDASTKRTLLIIMERAKRPIILTAAKFSVLSLTSFASVMRSSYSYFALMQQLYSEAQ